MPVARACICDYILIVVLFTLFLFIANQINGADFFDMDTTDIYQMIPRFKLRKKFLTLWSEVTSQTQVRIIQYIVYDYR